MNTSPRSRLTVQQVTTMFVSQSHGDHALLKNIISRSNWNLHSAFNCKEALALLRRESIAVVICDRDLPDGSWRDLREKCEAMESPPRIIVTSREVNEYLWADVLQMGGYDLLAMPWEPKEVLKVISLAWRSWEFAQRAALPTRRPDRPVATLTRAAAATAMAS